MRVFTDAEKLQLQAKIEAERERQRILREMIQLENERESKRRRGIISTAFSFKYGFLFLIICLFVLSVTPLLVWRDFDNFGYDQFVNIVVTLMLLFNHIAFQFTKSGRLSRVMKTVAWVWMIFGLVYVVYILLMLRGYSP